MHENGTHSQPDGQEPVGRKWMLYVLVVIILIGISLLGSGYLYLRLGVASEESLPKPTRVNVVVSKTNLAFGQSNTLKIQIGEAIPKEFGLMTIEIPHSEIPSKRIQNPSELVTGVEMTVRPQVTGTFELLLMGDQLVLAREPITVFSGGTFSSSPDTSIVLFKGSPTFRHESGLIVPIYAVAFKVEKGEEPIAQSLVEETEIELFKRSSAGIIPANKKLTIGKGTSQSNIVDFVVETGSITLVGKLKEEQKVSETKELVLDHAETLTKLREGAKLWVRPKKIERYPTPLQPAIVYFDLEKERTQLSYPEEIPIIPEQDKTVRFDPDDGLKFKQGTESSTIKVIGVAPGKVSVHFSALGFDDITIPCEFMSLAWFYVLAVIGGVCVCFVAWLIGLQKNEKRRSWRIGKNILSFVIGGIGGGFMAIVYLNGWTSKIPIHTVDECTAFLTGLLGGTLGPFGVLGLISGLEKYFRKAPAVSPKRAST